MVPTVLERWSQGSAVGYDIFSRLLKERIVFVGGQEGVVTTDSANLVISQLLYLDAEDSEKDIHLYINSPGGMVTAGLAVYDTMQFVKAPISTLCMGMAMSFGAVLLAAGSKGKRFALPHARIMIHQPLIRGGLSGQASDIVIEAEEMGKTKERLTDILALHSGQERERLFKDMERNHYMSAAEAKAYGLIDEVLPFLKAAPAP
ncbi:MAG: ATP-dependent Clp protease proteolytic subunit [Elusimicrobia bacterium]|nr:ATP-dependent Clp protease proteolytic subunit [Elusimicrobiota bacterium]MDE2237427.1 ATP-dependent Clp protease proteolytic subunit [Elusimicrobiota bacterium]MDE2424789.1 ATP-dependent Clp protease proteolytic subunit [Elusimicrobiota bacterium]